MTRNRATARAAGTRFERQIANYLATHVDDRIDRRARTGAKDRGDITGLRTHGQRLVAELKNTTRTNLAQWATETETERGNDDALAGLIIHKRHGNNQPADQWVTLTLGNLVALLTGNRDHLWTPPADIYQPTQPTTEPEQVASPEDVDAAFGGKAPWRRTPSAGPAVAGTPCEGDQA